MKNLLFLILLVMVASCNKTGGAFQNLEEEPADNQPVPGVVKIKTFTPSANPVIFTASNNITFAVSVFDGAGEVNYNFLLDNTTSLQSGESPFLEVAGSSLGNGDHTLKVVASSATSSDSKVFNLRKNNPPSVISFTPALTGSLLNCSQDTLTMSAVTTDLDGDVYSHKWFIDGIEVTGATSYTVVSNTTSSAQIAYTPDCSVAGFHQFALQINDGYEVTTTTWSVSVVNPAVETIISYYPTSNNITALSNETSKAFNASGSGVGSLTFIWKLDGATVKTETGVVSSNYILNTTSGILSTGNHTLEVTLTDSTLANDPPSPVTRSWLIYKNQKPTILSPIPSAAKLINLNTQLGLTANVQDALDTITVTITKGALTCVPASQCGLSSVVLPTSSGSFSAIFSPGTTFLGSNTFQLKVTDSYGEFETYSYNVSANYFSDSCNNLTAGKICTLAGLPGLGSGLNTLTESNKVRVTPTWITEDDQGNFFFADHATNTIWYYNTKSNPVTLWASSSPSATIVPANSLYVVAGTGVAGSGGSGQLAKEIPMNFGTWGGGMAWDSLKKELYIADYSNSRVIRVDQTGIGTTFCGSGSSNVNNTIASAHACSYPVNVAFDSSNRRLYVSLYNVHTIKYFDVSDASTSNWRGFILVGANGSAANTDGTINLSSFPATTITGTARLNGPWGLKLDLDDNILYIAEYSSCRVRALGLPGATTRNVAGVNITSNNLITLAGSGCASPTINTNTTFSSNLFNRPMGIDLLKSGSSVTGVFVSDYGGSRITFLNNSASTVTIGNQSVSSQRAINVFGSGNTVTQNPPTGVNTAVVNPFGLLVKNNVLYVGSRGNSAISTLNISTSNGAVDPSYLGGTSRAAYSGNAALDSRLVTFNSPVSLMYNSSNNLMYVSDRLNYMIRSINLSTGRVEDFIGTGSSQDESVLNTVTTATRIRSPRGMTMYNDMFLYADGGNNNCFVRAYNPLATDQLVFNTLVNLNRTNTIAGFYTWCTNFVGTTALDTTDANARVRNPYGVGVDTSSDVMYITSNTSHCVLKVTAAGTMVPVLGTCGTAAGSATYGGSYPDQTLLLNSPAELIMDPLYPENFFFADYSASTLAHVKYVNTTGSTKSFFNNTRSVAGNSVGTVLASTSSPGYIRALAAFEDWICFTSGATGSGQGDNTVVCRNRDNGVQQVFGVSGAGGIQLGTEQEGISAISGSSTITFSTPSGLAFDGEGNLYVSEESSHVIRKISKWW